MYDGEKGFTDFDRPYRPYLSSSPSTARGRAIDGVELLTSRVRDVHGRREIDGPESEDGYKDSSPSITDPFVLPTSPHRSPLLSDGLGVQPLP